MHNYIQCHIYTHTTIPDMVRLYCPIGSAKTPETAGPIIRPRLHAQIVRDIPNAWVWLLDDSDMMALMVPTTPSGKENTFHLIMLHSRTTTLLKEHTNRTHCALTMNRAQTTSKAKHLCMYFLTPEIRTPH